MRYLLFKRHFLSLLYKTAPPFISKYHILCYLSTYNLYVVFFSLETCNLQQQVEIARKT